MGDVAMISPIVAMLNKTYPNLDVYILTRPFFKAFFKPNKNIHFVDIDLNNRHKGIWGMLVLFIDMYKKYGRFNYVADLHYMIRSRFIRLLMKYLMFSKTAKLDKARTEKKELLKNKSFDGVPRVYKQYIKVFSDLGFPVEIPSDYKFEKKEIPLIFSDDKNIKIGIAPFALYQGKTYPMCKMESVIDVLSKKENISLYIFGGGDNEKLFADEISNRYSNVHSAIGILSLEEELNLISNMNCMITMDSSSMHMASLYGIKTITIWGATNPKSGFLGINQDPNNVLESKLSCSPCSIYGNLKCKFGDYRCFNDITPEMILDKVMKIINE